jgi:hypothetical protein
MPKAPPWQAEPSNNDGDEAVSITKSPRLLQAT